MLWLLLILTLKKKILEEFTTAGMSTINLTAGKYKFDCYGAQGGDGIYDFVINPKIGFGGKGAHAAGTLSINGTGTLFYLNVGGKGESSRYNQNKGGFNGGGSSGYDQNSKDKLYNSGGGGGATDIRVDKNDLANRIIVAAGGSGAAYFNDGAPGGDLTGKTSITRIHSYFDIYFNKIHEFDRIDVTDSTETTQSKGNKNGVGGDGVNSNKVPGSGGGGGWMGGVSSGKEGGESDPCYAVAHSGSSYISGHSGCKLNKKYVFSDTKMEVGVQEKDGKITITTIYVCPDKCYYCTNGNICIECIEGTRKNAKSQCEDCPANCKKCDASADKCEVCKTNYYMYDSQCYSSCSQLNKDGSYFGPNPTAKTCEKCKDDHCVDCSSNSRSCSECEPNYYFDKTEKKCKIIPTRQFSSSEKFSLSSQFTRTFQFTGSDSFSKTNDFSGTSKFSQTKGFSNTNAFSFSNAFTASMTPMPEGDKVACMSESSRGNITREDCEFIEDEENDVIIHVIRSNFTNYIERDKCGGAVRIENCGFRCISICFTHCITYTCGGGAIYIRNSLKVEHNLTLHNISVRECQAMYGGGIYIYSQSEENEVRITSSTFSQNFATETKKTKANKNMFNGNHLFITAKNLFIKECMFEKGSRINPGSAVKIYNVFVQEKKMALKLDESQNHVMFANCYFEFEDGSKSSINYIDAKNTSKIELIGCNFAGKLGKDSHYIDGKVGSKDNDNIKIVSCKFENANDEAVSIDIFKEEELIKSIEVHENASFPGFISFSFLIIAFAGAFVVTPLIIMILKVTKRKNGFDEEID